MKLNKFKVVLVIKKVTFLFLFLFTYAVFAQQDVSIMSYNLLNFSSNNSTEKQNAATTVINYVNPDLLIIEELSGDNPHLVLYDHLDKSEYGVGDYIKGYNSNKAIYYKKSKFTFISNTAINTALRDINEFKLVSIYTGDTIRVYGVHLQASSGSTSEAARLEEVKLLRGVTDKLNEGSVYFVCGDFNIYKSTEAGYQELLNQNTSGFFIDPISMSGSFGQSQYAQYHTQSSRKDGFGGGGMDDRFDMVLHSKVIENGVKVSYNSTEVIGNDGEHYDKAVTDLPNNSAPFNVIQALFDASDHLPVVARYTFKKTVEDTVKVDSPMVTNKPQLIITEFSSEGFEDWVEIYNASGSTLNLADYSITEYLGSGPSLNTKYNLDPNSLGTTISPGEYAVIIDDSDLESSFIARWPGFPFSSSIVVSSLFLFSSDEIIIVKNSNDSIIDKVTWASSTELKEFTGGTLPIYNSSETAMKLILTGNSDDASNWTLSSLGTPGKANDIPTAISVDSDKSLDNQFMMYPNPSNGKVFLKLNTENTEAHMLKIYNLLGSLVISQGFNGFLELDLPKGIYIVNVYNNSGYVVSKKLIVNE